MAHEALKAQFVENLNRQTKAVPEVGLLRLSLDGKLLRTVANVPGQSGSLRVLTHVSRNGRLTAQGVAEALEIFGPLVGEAKDQPGAHPTIDLLLALGRDQEVEIETLTTSPDLFSKLLDGTASVEEKREAVNLLDQGKVRCAEKYASFQASGGRLAFLSAGVWVTQTHGVACMNAGFSAFPMERMGEHFYDKVPLKTDGWTDEDFEKAGVRFVPGSFARRGAYIGAGTTIMPGGIVNIGAYVAGAGVLVDGGARVATGAQIGKGVKLGAGSGIEGILEPPGRLPSIIEDNVRIGANCELCGIIEEGAVLASGVVMASGKKIFDLRTGEELEPRYMAVGEAVFQIPVVPANRVAVSGVYSKSDKFSIDCVLLLEKDASDTSLAKMPRNASLYIKV